MSTLVIRKLRFHETPAFLDLFHQVFGEVSSDDTELTETIWCDVSSERTMSMTAWIEEELVGLLHAALYQHTLYIVALGVKEEYRRRSVASRLYQRLMKECEGLQITGYRVSDYPYGYIMPGVWQPGGIAFFTSLGFSVESTPVAMERDLRGFFYDTELGKRKESLISQGYVITQFDKAQALQVVDFFDRCMAADWKDIIKFGYIKGTLRDNGICCFNPEGTMIGCTFYGLVGRDLHRFGPIGVDPVIRGLSIGRILLEECLLMQHDRGLDRSYFLWCYENSPAFHMYSRSGFTVTHTMQIMSKPI